MEPEFTLPPNSPSANQVDNSVPPPTQPANAVLASQPLSMDAPQLPNSESSSQPASASAPAIADDVDLIEKEWIQKIKEIVQHTIGDPFERNRQISILKSEYMQKRYNKTIKLS